jgi:hypothetical protein
MVDSTTGSYTTRQPGGSATRSRKRPKSWLGGKVVMARSIWQRTTDDGRETMDDKVAGDGRVTTECPLVATVVLSV